MRIRATLGTTIVAAAGLLLWLAPASAQDQGTAAQPGQQHKHQKHAAKPMSDKEFAMKAAQGGMAEVELGQLAVDHASNQDVKKFGQRMVTDHGKANDQLKQIAANEGITLPTSVDKKDQDLKHRLSSLSGAEFDREYMRAMVRDHKHDIAEFKREADSGTDPQLKSFASSTLPTLDEHLQMAQQTASEVNTMTRTSPTGTSGNAAQEQTQPQPSPNQTPRQQ